MSPFLDPIIDRNTNDIAKVPKIQLTTETPNVPKSTHDYHRSSQYNFNENYV